jgi:hypothetical protein
MRPEDMATMTAPDGANRLPLLPLGYQVFEKVRATRAVYVDKTAYLPGLPNLGQVVFCSRPRRFGKSLTVSTLDAFFSGRKDLFVGLAVEPFMHSPAFHSLPVIRLDMSSVAGSDSAESLKASLLSILNTNAERHNLGFWPKDADPADAFREMSAALHRKTRQQAVVLIDEYDAPVLRLVQQPGTIRDARLIDGTRSLMQTFYAQIKAAEEHIYFTFITGVSKFSRMGVFSSLNNILDISLSPDYAAFMGITHAEMTKNFAFFIMRAAEKFGITPEELAERIKTHYNGFSFDGITRVYNPFSSLSFFTHQEFGNYWVESGSSSVIREFLKEKHLTVEQFRGMPVSRNFVSSPGEIEKTSPEGFLYQAGYLTLRKDRDGEFTLDYPNFEVLSTLSWFFVENLFPNERDADRIAVNTRKHFMAGNVPGIVEELNRLYASLSYLDYIQVERRKNGESFYRAMLLSFLSGAGIIVRSEEHNNLGRADIVAEYGGRTFVVEMKTVADASTATAGAEEGMAQIHKRDYGNKYRNPILLSLAVDEKNRKIGAWLADTSHCA